MLINWFTVVAQIINFLILVVLLQRFLYQPILQVIKKRQALIDEQWQEAKLAQSQAQIEADNYRQQQQKLQFKEARIMEDMRQKVDGEYHHLLTQVRQEVEEIRVNWQSGLLQEQNDFLQSLKQKIVQQTHLIVHRVLADLASADLETQILNRFCQRLQQIDPAQRQLIHQSLQHTSQPIIIYSSFEIPPIYRQTIMNFFHGEIGINHQLEFKISPDLICGIQIQLVDHLIAWNIDDYLQNLESHFSQSL